jgi:hypothetical protein
MLQWLSSPTATPKLLGSIPGQCIEFFPYVKKGCGHWSDKPTSEKKQICLECNKTCSKRWSKCRTKSLNIYDNNSLLTNKNEISQIMN